MSHGPLEPAPLSPLHPRHMVLWQARLPGPEVTYVSPDALAVLGYDAAALIGPIERLLAHFEPGDREALTIGLAQLEAGAELSHDCRATRLDGKAIHVRVSAYRTNGKHGPGAFVGCVLDLSEAIAAAQALVSAESRTRAIVTTAVDGIIAIDADGRIESANPAALGLFGYTAEEVFGKNVSMLMPSPYHEEHDGYVAHYLETGEKRIIGIGREVTGLRKDGSTFPMDLAVGEAVVDGGQLFTGIIRDISGRKESERALLDAESRMRAIVDTTVDGILAIDESGTVSSMNPAAETIFGYRSEEVIGNNVSMLMPSPYHEEHDAYVANYLETGEKKIIGIGREVEGLRKDGTTFPMDLAVGEAVVDGRRFFTGVVRDITERKRTEDALRDTQKLESLAVLAGGIAHDFNNLLVGILGNASLALEELPLTSPVREHLSDVQTAARRAAELARQMLAYSGRGRFIIQDIDVNELVEEMGQLLRISVANQATVRYNYAPSLPRIEADATQIRQVLMNLVMNASDAIGEGPGLITLTTGVANVDREYLAETYLGGEVPEGHYVSVEVSDTGEGMAPDVMARIFDPFFTTKFTGRGLGLAAVLGIVRAHRGTIRVYSELGKGTTFKLLLPPSPNAVIAPSNDSVEDLTGRGAVLVVDDEVFARQVAERTLRPAGFDVLVAQDGEAALKVLDREGARVRLVLLDLTMPGLSGAETYSRIRVLHKDLPVLLMSGYTEEEATSTFAGKGIAGFLQKPYIPQDLRAIVRRVFEAEDEGR